MAVGLVNGLLIGGIGLNPLIVTLAVGQIVNGIAYRYFTAHAIQTPIAPSIAAWPGNVDHCANSPCCAAALVRLSQVLLAMRQICEVLFTSVAMSTVPPSTSTPPADPRCQG